MTMIKKLTLAGAIVTLCVSAAHAQTADKPVVDEPANKEGSKTTGAMDKAVGGTATSPDDVKRQTEGRPTAAEEAKGVKPTNPRPNITEQSPGTVGAAPGTTAPMEQKKQ